MIRINNIIMSKKTSELSFQEKFKDRSEIMGKDGVFGIIKTTNNPIEKNVNNSDMNNNSSNLEDWNSIFTNSIFRIINR